MLNIKTFLTKDIPVKISALLCAFGCWYLFNTLQSVHSTYEIPVHFNSTDMSLDFKYPTTITANIQGTKASLYTLSSNEMVVYLDGTRYTTPGTYTVIVKPEDIIIPSSVKLLHYSPAIVQLTIT